MCDTRRHGVEHGGAMQEDGTSSSGRAIPQAAAKEVAGCAALDEGLTALQRGEWEV